MLHRIPFLRLLLFFSIGIIVQWHKNISDLGELMLAVVAFLFIGLSFIPKLNSQHRFRYLFGVGLSFLLFTAAVFLTKAIQKQSEWNLPTEDYQYRAIITDEPVDKPKTWMCKIRITAAEETIHSVATGKKAVIYLSKDNPSPMPVAGNSLLFTARLSSAPPYLKKQAVAASGFIRKNQWTIETDSLPAFSIRLKALSIRRVLLHHLRQMIPDPSAYSIAAALMFGYRNEVEDTLMQSVRNIGAAHILAISGMHFAILFGMLAFLLSTVIDNSLAGKRLKQGILLPLAWGFAFLTGFSPSVVRAVLMLSIWGVGQMLAYRAFTLNTVTAAAFLMLVFHPLYLFDAGWQLSFLAVVSILLLNPYLFAAYQSENPILRYLWGVICVSLSAQAGVTPLSVYYFHQFPVLFLLANICLLPLATILLALIPLSMLLHTVCGNFRGLLYPLNRTLDLFLSTVQHLDRFSHNNITNLHINQWDTALLSLSILLFALLWIKKRAVYLYFLLILLACYAIYRF
jgi:competence protein ComEC